LRLPSQSLTAPENTLTMALVASAIPSISPTDRALAPSTVTRNTGKRLWMISEEVSISSDTTPSATTVRGTARIPAATGELGSRSAGRVMVDSPRSEGRSSIRP
jgi:hypothetical protein